MVEILPILGGAVGGFVAGYMLKTIKKSEIIPAIDVDGATEAESPEIDCSKYKKFTAFINANSGNFVIEVFYWNGEEWKKYDEDFWGSLIYVEAMMPVAEALSGDILGNLMKIRATSLGNTFQLDLKIQMN